MQLNAVFKGGDQSGIMAYESSEDVDDNIFDLQGRKLSNETTLPKGIYIKNGRKVVKR